MTDSLQIISFREHVRKRPGMYLGSGGNKGIIKLIAGLMIDFLGDYPSAAFVFICTISTDNQISLQVNSPEDLSAAVPVFTQEPSPTDFRHAQILHVVTEKLELAGTGSLPLNELILQFSLDPLVFKETAIDYFHLLEELQLLAMLNRRVEIVIKDTTEKYVNQNYLAYPQGVFYLYERIKRNVLGTPEWELLYDDSVNGNQYQIVLAYRMDWYPRPNVTSFSNDHETIYGGDLVNGIIDGLLAASKKYVIGQNLLSHKISRTKIHNGLIIVCAVRGKDLAFGGSFRESLISPVIRKDIKEIISALLLDYFNRHEEIAIQFLRRFDENHLMNSIYRNKLR